MLNQKEALCTYWSNNTIRADSGLQCITHLAVRGPCAGLYGSMNSLLYDHATVAPRPLRLSGSPGQQQQQQPGCGSAKTGAARRGAVFGPSCDGLDTVLHDYALPELEVGDWLVFPRHGAYTFSGACAFNGMDPTPTNFYVFSEQ